MVPGASGGPAETLARYAHGSRRKAKGPAKESRNRQRFVRNFAAKELAMDSKREVFRLLDIHRAELVRRNKHEIYRLPNGQIFVTGKTQTDERGWRDRLAQLRKLLGIKPLDKGAAPGKRKLMARKNKTSNDAPNFVSLQSPSGLRSLASELKKLLPEFRPRQSYRHRRLDHES